MRLMSIFTKNKDRGFTLVEVIFSIAFLCIAGVLIIQLFIASGDVRSDAVLREAAALKAANAIEACRIAVEPSEIGHGIFNDDFTDFRETDTGYAIRIFYGDDWTDPVMGVSPVFVVTIELDMTDAHPALENTSDDTKILSALYDINVTAGYVDTTREDSTLCEITTARHFVIRGNNDD